jgi:RND family efflux transporter MFP subunit
LTGAIMSVGVATANSILMVSFARERMNEGDDPITAASDAGFTRLRPVLMTALAMIIGMVPMAIGLGEGGEQNAPLGRAVIGGLLFATTATLFFVPVVFTAVSSRHRLWIVIAIAAVLLIVVWGIYSRIHAEHRLQKETDDRAIPTVTVVQVKSSPADEELVLPGNVQANLEAAIYARTSGYLKKWYTDIGAPVKAGQILADIDTPEIDDQLRQAQADLATAVANSALAESTAKRWKTLLQTDSVSKQEAEEKVGDAQAKAAMVASSRANVERLREMEGFKHVVAPFDGVVTARDTDVGALINAGSGVGPELFRVADKATLRIYIQVPQTYASVVVPGMVVDLVFPEHPGRTFKAKMVRNAQALDPTARTLLVELRADNADGELLPGGLAEVHLKSPASSPSVRVPASALLFRAEGLRVATVENDRATLHEVTLGRDFGKEIEILTGIAAGQSVIIDPPDSLMPDQQVRIAKDTPPNGKPSGGDTH